MILMLFPPGASKTIMERWCIRDLQDELSSFLLMLSRIYVQVKFFSEFLRQISSGVDRDVIRNAQKPGVGRGQSN